MDGKQKILVTGASGFVGMAILEELLQVENYDIYCLKGKNSNSISFDKLEPKKIFQGDISDYQTLRPLEELKNVDFLIHCAGLAHQFGRTSKKDFWDVNVKGTENICDLAKKIGVKHFILIGSVAVYGEHGNAEIDETFVCRPVGFYAESKLESERKAIEICEKNKIPLTILRLGTVIGEGDRGNTVRLITNIDRGRFFWIGKGENKKSLIYKNDVAKGVLQVIQAEKKNRTEIYNLTAETISMKDVVEAIFVNLGKKMPRINLPAGLIQKGFRLNDKTISSQFIKKIAKTIEKWLSDDKFSNKKFSEAFLFETQTPITEAIARQVKSYLKHKKTEKN